VHVTTIATAATTANNTTTSSIVAKAKSINVKNSRYVEGKVEIK
jgi:hypothetical protein